MIINKKLVKGGSLGNTIDQTTTVNDGKVQIHNNQHRVNMYDEAPQNVISLHEFQSIALDRLQMLRKIEFM